MAAGVSAAYGLTDDGRLRPIQGGHGGALLAWHPGSGWECIVPPSDPRRSLIDLYLPVCSATSASATTVGHLGQSLDGFIATHAGDSQFVTGRKLRVACVSGDSQFVTGRENILHLHRM